MRLHELKNAKMPYRIQVTNQAVRTVKDLDNVRLEFRAFYFLNDDTWNVEVTTHKLKPYDDFGIEDTKEMYATVQECLATLVKEKQPNLITFKNTNFTMEPFQLDGYKFVKSNDSFTLAKQGSHADK